MNLRVVIFSLFLAHTCFPRLLSADELLRAEFLEVNGRVRDGMRALKALNLKEQETKKNIEELGMKRAEGFFNENRVRRSLQALSLLRASLQSSLDGTRAKQESVRRLTMKRIRAVYMLNSERLILHLLSGKDTQRGSKNALYLKRIQQQDNQLIHQYVEIFSHLLSQSMLLQGVWVFGKNQNDVYEEERLLQVEARQLEEQLLLTLQDEKEAIKVELKKLKRDAEKLSGAIDYVTKSNEKPSRAVLIRPLSFPIVGTIVQHFGKSRREEFEDLVFNKGIEFLAPEGTSVYPVASGVIKFVGRLPSYGTVILIQHSPHEFSLYGRIEEPAVRQEMQVSIKTVLGKVGSADKRGRSLYFELRQGGKVKNPEGFFS